MTSQKLQNTIDNLFHQNTAEVIKNPFDLDPNNGVLLEVVKDNLSGLYYFFWSNSVGAIHNKVIGYQDEYDHILERALSKNPQPFLLNGYYKGGEARYENIKAKNYILDQLRWGLDPDAFLPFTIDDKTA